MSQQQYEAVVNHNEKFKAIAAYLSTTNHPTYSELHKSVRNQLRNEKFRLWMTLSDYERSSSPANEGYNNLKGFFAYLGISDMESFVHDPDGQKIWKLFKRWGEDMLRIHRGTTQLTHKLTNNDTMIYFFYPGKIPYNSYNAKSFGGRCQVISCLVLDFDRLEINIRGTWQTAVVKSGNTYEYSKYFDYNS